MYAVHSKDWYHSIHRLLHIWKCLLPMQVRHTSNFFNAQTSQYFEFFTVNVDIQMQNPCQEHHIKTYIWESFTAVLPGLFNSSWDVMVWICPQHHVSDGPSETAEEDVWQNESSGYHHHAGESSAMPGFGLLVFSFHFLSKCPLRELENICCLKKNTGCSSHFNGLRRSNDRFDHSRRIQRP